MNDHERRWAVRWTQHLAGQIVADLDALVCRLREFEGGYPSTTYGRMTSRALSSSVEIQAATHDPARQALRELDKLVHQVNAKLVQIDTLRANWLYQSKADQSDAGPPGCRSHARLQRYAEVYRDDRCRFCYDWWLSEKVDPPLALVKAKDDGRRITNKLVAELTTHHPGKRPRRSA